MLISGVVRDDDGVETFRGSIDGEREEVRRVCSGCGVGGVLGMGGAGCMIDNLFARRASVGLIVLAPSPVAMGVPDPGITDIRFEDDGVVVRLLGDFVAKEADLVCSGVLEFTVRSCPCRVGGCKDFVFAALEAVKPRAPSVYVGVPLELPTPLPSPAPCGVLVFDAKLGRRL